MVSLNSIIPEEREAPEEHAQGSYNLLCNNNVFVHFCLMHFEDGNNLGLCLSAERQSQCQIRMFTLEYEIYSAEFRLSFDAKTQKKN